MIYWTNVGDIYATFGTYIIIIIIIIKILFA